MLTVSTCKDYGHALGKYLRQADYYSQGMKVEGVCYGDLCEELGLKVGRLITDEEFAALAQNHHARTGKQLTARMAAKRRAGYDAVFSAPKSVSIQCFVGGDHRLISAHDKAVVMALREVERHACCQTGQGLNKFHKRTGKIAAALFQHGESRALDPQLHTHSFIFNVTRGADGRLVALETGDIFASATYFTEVYRNALASELRSLGYAITSTQNGFELTGVPRELIERFSKRARDRDAAVSAREKELGRKLTRNETAVLVRARRKEKMVELSPDQVRASQLAQVSQSELNSLQKIRESTSRPLAHESVAIADLIQRAKEHVFERQAVVSEPELLAEAIRASYGEHSLSEIQRAIVHGQHGLLVVNGRVSTVEAVEHERELIARINSGIGAQPTLGRMPEAAVLSEEQRRAVQKILDCRDTVQVFRGKAGTGKTTTLTQIIEGCASKGNEALCFAPSSKAVEALRREGAEHEALGLNSAARTLIGANTVQHLLANPSMQSSVAGKVVIVDEYGLLSTRDLKRLLDLVESQKGRLLLVGDAAQHTSVEAGAGARLIERESRVSIAEICEIRRQAANRDYLRAAEALAAGDLQKGLAILERHGAVVEIANEKKCRSSMVNEWFEVNHGANAKFRHSKTALMIAPTWAEIDELNRVARERLRAGGILKGDETEFGSLWRRDWTRAQNKDARNYEAGQVLLLRKTTKHFRKRDELTVLRRDGDRLVVRDQRRRETSISPRQCGTAWTVCDNRPITLAKGDEIRLRANGHLRANDGRIQLISNGSTFKVAGIGADGHVRLADGSILLSREFVHAYATTSHASQGATVDMVFMTDPLSREGLYVSATRGREKIRIFTTDKPALLEAARLRSEDRMSATEFIRQSPIAAGPIVRKHHRGTIQDLRELWENGVERGRTFAQLCMQRLRPWWASRSAAPIQAELRRARVP